MASFTRSDYEKDGKITNKQNNGNATILLKKSDTLVKFQLLKPQKITLGSNPWGSPPSAEGPPTATTNEPTTIEYSGNGNIGDTNSRFT